MEQLTQSELLTKVKEALNITGTYQDATLLSYIEEVQHYMIDAGVKIAIINSSLCVGAICRGVSDLWNYGSGNAHFSQYFKQRVIQLASWDGEIPPTPTGPTVSGFELYPDGAGVIKGSRILFSDETFIDSKMVVPDSLTLTSTATDVVAQTIITVSPALTEGNSYKVKAEFGTTLATPAKCDDVSDWDDWDGVSVIDAANNYRLVVVECDTSGCVVKTGYVTVSARIF